MGRRRRGESTKEKILEVACAVFAEMGYRDATHAEICRRAGVNTAAINYYFESKESLYRAAFLRLTERVEKHYPLDGGLSSGASAEERLKAFIRAHLQRVFDPDLMGDVHRIVMAEMFDATGLLKDLMDAQLAKDRAHVRSVLGELLGPETEPRRVDWCEMSVISQCFIGGPGPVDKAPKDQGPRALFGLAADSIDQLTDHIYTFSLAGIRAVAKEPSRTTQGVKQKASRHRNVRR